jgi:hypothetical protein
VPRESRAVRRTEPLVDWLTGRTKDALPFIHVATWADLIESHVLYLQPAADDQRRCWSRCCVGSWAGVHVSASKACASRRRKSPSTLSPQGVRRGLSLADVPPPLDSLGEPLRYHAHGHVRGGRSYGQRRQVCQGMTIALDTARLPTGSSIIVKRDVWDGWACG